MGIVYSKKNGVEYAVYQGRTVIRPDGKGFYKEYQVYLGRVVDKDNSIYYSQQHGLFRFDENELTKDSIYNSVKGFMVEDFDQACNV